ncbi:helix-turn-helix domain-containing protein [Georgenia faecalis]|uniref:Helix-turn-helix domain-containing protein n=1 Tax=Georgenia faecalis TaxID=2483799 RepID=A0ABV9DB70_9MICO|nr:helix-turn-helix domain-containing protein [Georgenia faecalis]
MGEREMSALVVQAGDDDPLRALGAVAELHREVNRAEEVAVRRARMRGASWADIARELGVSRQAVHKKYGGSRFGRD